MKKKSKDKFIVLNHRNIDPIGGDIASGSIYTFMQRISDLWGLQSLNENFVH